MDYRRLSVWEKAHELTLMVYRATAAFPDAERFGLTSQLRRAAVSIPSNIAEGAGRGSDKDWARFIGIALGSTNELEYQLLLCRDLGYLDKVPYRELLDLCQEVRRMLTGFRHTLDASTN